MRQDITKPEQQNKSDDRIKKLLEYLPVQPDILIAFVFGSFASGDMRAMSDLDIALLFDGKIDLSRVGSMREELADLLGIDVDIVVLNTAAPVIKMQVLKKSRLLHVRERRAYNEFFVTTVKEYDDLKRNRKEIEDNILKGRIYA
jgi:uncharacterized protein